MEKCSMIDVKQYIEENKLKKKTVKQLKSMMWGTANDEYKVILFAKYKKENKKLPAWLSNWAVSVGLDTKEEWPTSPYYL